MVKEGKPKVKSSSEDLLAEKWVMGWQASKSGTGQDTREWSSSEQAAQDRGPTLSWTSWPDTLSGRNEINQNGHSKHCIYLFRR